MLPRSLALMALLAPLTASAAPLLLSHQGRMLDANADPLTGTQSVTFKVYATATGGAPVWTETLSVPFDNGYFSVVLGDQTALEDDDFDAWPIYLGMTVAGGTELSPRVEVVSVPFAVRARTSINVSGGVVDATEIRVDGDTVIDGSGNATFNAVDATSYSANGVEVIDGSGNASFGAVDASSISVGGTVVIDGSGTFMGSVGGAALEGLGCADDQYPVRRAGAWACEAVLGASTVRGMVTATPIALAAGSTIGGQAPITQLPPELADGDADTLAGLGCTNGTYAVRTGAGWTCASIVVDTDSDTLADLQCTDGDVAQLISGDWTCVRSVDLDVIAATTVDVGGAVLLGAVADGYCTGSTVGALVYDATLAALKLCTADGWNTIGKAARILQDQGFRRWSDGTFATACWDYRHPTSNDHLYDGAIGDGVYRVDPDGPGSVAPFDVLCEMTTDEGGWTLVDNSATGSHITTRTAGAVTSLATTKGAYLPGYTWSEAPQMLCKASYFTGSLPWLTLNVSGVNLEYPTATTLTTTSSGFSAGILNGNTNQGMTSYIYKASGRFGTVWVGNGSQPTCACDYLTDETGLGGYTTGNSVCSVWVR